MKLKISETGSILIEAMAMLGLIAMVTPILYKKAAERTTEIRDINAASEMRGLIKAVDDYLKDNYENIIAGQVVELDSQLTVAAGAESYDWGAFKAADNPVPEYKEYSAIIPIEHFAEYLPYGFLDEDGKAIGSRTFRAYEVAVKKVDSGALGQDMVAKQVLTGFVRGIPAEPDFPMMRASRIASMVGSNGGYGLNKDEVMGSQGIWGIENTVTDLDMEVEEGDIVTASIQSISSGAGDYEGVLYRKYRKERRLNTMETTLMMGNQSIKGVSQMIVTASGEDFQDGAGNPDPTKQANALILAEYDPTDILDGYAPGARIQGRIAAAVQGMKIVGDMKDQDIGHYKVEMDENTKDFRERFLVDEESNTSVDATFKAALTDRGEVDDGSNPIYPSRDKDTYNVEAEKEDVRIENERMSVGEAFKIFPIEAGAKREKTAKLDRDKALGDVNRYLIHDASDINSDSDSEQKDLNGQTRVKIEAESGVVIDSKVEGGDYEGETHFDINSKGVVATTDGSINLLTGDESDEQAASLQLGGTNVPGELGYDGDRGQVRPTGLGMSELYGRNVVNITTVRDTGGVDHNTGEYAADYYDEDGIARIDDPDTIYDQAVEPEFTGLSRLSMAATGEGADALSETTLESDVIDLITTNYANGYFFDDYVHGSRISLDTVDRAVGEFEREEWNRALIHSDVVHLHARQELHLETDKDLRLTAWRDFYNEYGRDYRISVLDQAAARDSGYDEVFSGNFVTHRTMYMNDKEAYLGNTDRLSLQGDRVEIGNYAGLDAKGNPPTALGNLNDLNTDPTGNYPNKDSSYPVMTVMADMNEGIARYGAQEVDIDNKGTLENETINIRRGIIEMSRNRVEIDVDKEDPRSYVRADRLVANEILDGEAIPDHGVDAGVQYDAYQVNPAYTSVMHDIKLTTRGGARLSDILPDFINKGIYVMDTTYKEGIGDWERFTIDGGVNDGGVKVTSEDVGEIKSSHEVSQHGYKTDLAVSPWAGFVPKPQCPPGYARVITVTPAGIAMAQAGAPLTKAMMQHQKTSDLGYTTDIPRDPFETVGVNGYAMDPLFFQKSTWFRAKAHPHYDGKQEPENFQGWSVILGFIYPVTYYKTYFEPPAGNDYFHELLTSDGRETKFPAGILNEFSVVWNLFPVYRKELEAYAMVYCYFDRTSNIYTDGSGKSKGYVDPYDQLNSYRMGTEKDSEYEKRLNDPTLMYTDPW